MSSSAIEIAMNHRAAELNAESWPTVLVRPIRQGIARIAARRQSRRGVKELMALDDRMLRDIGLCRSDIELAAWLGARRVKRGPQEQNALFGKCLET